MAAISSERVKFFIGRDIICRFGTPMAIVSDNRQQYVNKYTTLLYESMGTQNRYASVEHPKTNGKVNSANNVVIAGIKRRLDEAKSHWLEELLAVLWSYNTTTQSSTSETPFKLTYGTDVVLPVEFNNLSWRVNNMLP